MKKGNRLFFLGVFNGFILTFAFLLFLVRMDEEFQQLLKALGLKPGCIPTILNYYESTDTVSLTQKLHDIRAFQGILSPMKEVEGGWIPDFSSRYFTEDFPYGMRFIVETAHEHDVEIPKIEDVYQWGQKVSKTF